MSLKSFFESGIAYDQLAEGEHEVRMLERPQFVEHPTAPHVSFKITFADRTVQDNRFTEQSLSIMNNQLKTQLDIKGNVPAQALYDAMFLAESFKVWVSYNVKEGKRYRNINYGPPLEEFVPTAATAANAEALTDEDMPF